MKRIEIIIILLLAKENVLVAQQLSPGNTQIISLLKELNKSEN